MPKRRTTILGLGALAMGSGAAFTSAAFEAATAPGADMRVISDGRVTVRGNAGDDTNVYDLESQPGESIDFTNFNRNNLPRATFENTPDVDGTDGNINSDIDLTVGIELREDGTFTPLLEIDNDTEVNQDIAIHFEENTGGDGDNETYGADVGSSSDQVDRDTVQKIYQFKVDANDDSTFNTLISPEPGSNGVGGTNVDDGNTGANQVTVEAGNTLSIALHYDTNGVTGEINSAAGGNGEESPFGGKAQAVDLLNAIVVGAEETNE